MQCQATITFPHKVSIVFEDFDVGYHSDCSDDWLVVRDGDQSDSDLIEKLCGDDIPSPLESTGNSLTLIFNTDVDHNYKGFQIISSEIML